MKKTTYADLFKPQKSMALIVEEQESVLSKSENGSGSWLGASCSSGLSTPFESELGSWGTSGSVDEEFMAELSRQMAECMLDDDDDEKEEEEEEDNNNNTDGGCLYETLEVYKSKNQPQESSTGERRVKGNMGVQKTGRNHMNYRQNGQGMKAIFLDKSGSSYGSGGTGVFLPRFPNDPTPKKKKKPGCSTVLIPMRVLQTLDLHFSRLSGSSSPISHGTSPHCVSDDMPWTHPGLKDTRNDLLSQQNDGPRFQNLQANEEEEMQLPQEWTY